MRASAEVCEGVTSSLTERERERNWRVSLVRATSSPAASSTAPTWVSTWVSTFNVPREAEVERFMMSSICLVVSN